ncbi:MAG TPA: hypothetical protein VHC73_02420 [Vitreimonas sp.]|nr:hypothetical protein [Vitreimonas sp.]
MVRVLAFILTVALLPGTALARPAPLPPDLTPVGAAVLGLYAHEGAPEAEIVEPAQRTARDACRAKGLDYFRPNRESWLYATSTERVAFVERREQITDQNGCVSQTNIRRFVDRRAWRQGAWRPDGDREGALFNSPAWPVGFNGEDHCSGDRGYLHCSLARSFGVLVRCASSGVSLVGSMTCLVPRGRAQGLNLLTLEWSDDGSSGYEFRVNALEVHTSFDRAVFSAAAAWCTHWLPGVTSPCAPDRPGEKYEPASEY